MNVRKKGCGLKGADTFIKETKKRAKSSSSGRKLSSRDRDWKSARSLNSGGSKPSSSKWDGLRSKLGTSTGERNKGDSESKPTDREQTASNVDSAIDTEPLGKSAIAATSTKEDCAPTAEEDKEDNMNVRKKGDGLKGVGTLIKETKKRAKSSSSDRKSSSSDRQSSSSDRKSSSSDRDRNRKSRSRISEESRPSSSKWASLRGKIGGSADETKEGAHDSRSDLTTETEKSVSDPLPAPPSNSRNRLESPKDGLRDGKTSDSVNTLASLKGANTPLKETKCKTSSSNQNSSSRDRDQDRDRKSSRSCTSGHSRPSSLN
jgi:bifunctional autolysin